ncbi:MAG: hypothetical protein WBG41_18115 [Acidimicrobiales bacterium]
MPFFDEHWLASVPAEMLASISPWPLVVGKDPVTVAGFVVLCAWLPHAKAGFPLPPAASPSTWVILRVLAAIFALNPFHFTGSAAVTLMTPKRPVQLLPVLSVMVPLAKPVPVPDTLLPLVVQWLRVILAVIFSVPMVGPDAFSAGLNLADPATPVQVTVPVAVTVPAQALVTPTPATAAMGITTAAITRSILLDFIISLPVVVLPYVSVVSESYFCRL